jgi:hypothetical protein
MHPHGSERKGNIFSNMQNLLLVSSLFTLALTHIDTPHKKSQHDHAYAFHPSHFSTLL